MTSSLSAGAALLLTAAAVVAGLAVLAGTRRPGTALGVLLDLLLAAGLLRLAGSPGWRVIATAAVIVLLRRLIGVGLRAGARAWTGRLPRRPSNRLARVRTELHRALRPFWSHNVAD